MGVVGVGGVFCVAGGFGVVGDVGAGAFGVGAVCAVGVCWCLW